MSIDVDKLRITKIADSLYGNEIQKVDSEALYCEIQYKRDRSSFAGMAFKITNKENVINVRQYKEKIVKNVNKYEKLYMGCEQDYTNSIKKIFCLEKKKYGLEILFLVYSDVRSSRIIFEELMKDVDKNIDKIKELL